MYLRGKGILFFRWNK